MHLRRYTFVLVVAFSSAASSCYDPSPAFPVPSWTNGADKLSSCFSAIEKKLADVNAQPRYDTSSFSIEVTSATGSLWSQFHTARKRNETRPGVDHVDEDSLYRIASITKVFTVLGILYQHEAGNLSLDDSISSYIPELAGDIPWDDITLRILASQLSGIPREFAQGDLLNERLGNALPPATDQGLPQCDEYNGYKTACTRKDLLGRLKELKPVFAPNQKSTYSNVNFELLGLVIETVAGKNYSTYIREAIFEALNMSSSSLETPTDAHAVLPFGENYYWDVQEGVQNPTGGIYSSSKDMGKLMRYILTHYNTIATGVNWMMPSSWATGLKTFYGMPFEIFRTDAVLENSERPVTFVTKSGGLPGYFSRMSIMPEYGLGLTILVGGDVTLLSKIQEIVTVDLIRSAEEAAWKDVDKTYSGYYVAIDPALNSTLRLITTPATGLTVTSFVSNGTDVLHHPLLGSIVDEARPWHLQLVPTLLFKNERSQQGEIWRLLGVQERTYGVERGVWDDFCPTDDDFALYAGLPINEVVFWHERQEVELPAWNLTLKASKSTSEEGRLVDQTLT